MSEEQVSETGKNTHAEDKKKDALQIGVFVLVVLAVLTFGEYIIAITAPPWGMILLIIAVLKAFFIVRDYMHLPRLFSESVVVDDKERQE